MFSIKIKLILFYIFTMISITGKPHIPEFFWVVAVNLAGYLGIEIIFDFYKALKEKKGAIK